MIAEALHLGIAISLFALAKDYLYRFNDKQWTENNEIKPDIYDGKHKTALVMYGIDHV